MQGIRLTFFQINSTKMQLVVCNTGNKKTNIYTHIIYTLYKISRSCINKENEHEAIQQYTYITMQTRNKKKKKTTTTENIHKPNNCRLKLLRQEVKATLNQREDFESREKASSLVRWSPESGFGWINGRSTERHANGRISAAKLGKIQTLCLV